MLVVPRCNARLDRSIAIPVDVANSERYMVSTEFSNVGDSHPPTHTVKHSPRIVVWWPDDGGSAHNTGHLDDAQMCKAQLQPSQRTAFVSQVCMFTRIICNLAFCKSCARSHTPHVDNVNSFAEHMPHVHQVEGHSRSMTITIALAKWSQILLLV